MDLAARDSQQERTCSRKGFVMIQGSVMSFKRTFEAPALFRNEFEYERASIFRNKAQEGFVASRSKQVLVSTERTFIIPIERSTQCGIGYGNGCDDIDVIVSF